MECICCHSKQIKKNGFYKDYQKYRCQECGRQFSERSFSFFCRHRFPDEVIRNAVLFNFFISIRNTKYLLSETIQFKPSHVSVFRWSKKFAQHLSKLPQSKAFSNIWHVDEKFIKVKDSPDDFAYLWTVIDDKNSMIAVHVSPKRDIQGAKEALKKARNNAEKPPDILISDGLAAYPRAISAIFGRKIRHCRRHFKAEAEVLDGNIMYLSNNRLESLNSKINLWYKKFRGFKGFATAQLWADAWMYFYNLMRPRVKVHQTISIHQII